MVVIENGSLLMQRANPSLVFQEFFGWSIVTCGGNMEILEMVCPNSTLTMPYEMNKLCLYGFGLNIGIG